MSYFGIGSPSSYLGRKASSTAVSPVSPSSSNASPLPIGASPAAVASSPKLANSVELRDPLKLWMSDTTQAPIGLLSKRLKEVESLAGALQTYFEGLAGAHSAHSSQLTPLNKALAGVQLSGWIPTHIEGGFNGLIDSLKETNAAITAEHDLLSKRIKEEVCPPIKKAKADLDLKRREIEKEAKGMPEAVLKEREATNAALLALSEACSSIVPLQPAQDPVLLRYAFDSQLRVQVDKENDLLVRAQRWTQDAKQVERAAFDAIAQAWSIWSEANSNMLLSNQQRSVLLSATIDSIPSDAEWNHFANPSVGQAVPLDAEPQQADEIDIPNRQDPQTEPLRQGLLERQKGWVKTWKPAWVVLTPSGNLHAFATTGPINAQTPNSALKPILSVTLSQSTLGPFANDDSAFVIDSPDAGKVVLRVPPSPSAPSKDVDQDRIAKEREEWCTLVEKFTAAVVTNAEKEQDAKEEGDLGMASTDKTLPNDPSSKGQRLDDHELPATPVKRAVPPPPLPPRTSSDEPIESDIALQQSPTSNDIRSHSNIEGDIGSVSASSSLAEDKSNNRLSTADTIGTSTSTNDVDSTHHDGNTSIIEHEDDRDGGQSTPPTSARTSTYAPFKRDDDDEEDDDDRQRPVSSTSSSEDQQGKRMSVQSNDTMSSVSVSAHSNHQQQLSQNEASSATTTSTTQQEQEQEQEQQGQRSRMTSSSDADDEEDDDDEEGGARPSPFEFSDVPDSPSRPSIDRLRPSVVAEQDESANANDEQESKQEGN